MKIFTLAFGLFLATGCSSFFKREPSSANGQKPKHYIMTLHGVRGTETAFGDFHALIKMHLEKIDPSFEVVPINIVYPKGMALFNAHDSVAVINQKLDAAIPVLYPQDKISVLAYSMGGQIGMTWYYDSMKDEAHKKYPLQTKKFFSVGAAYWGSKEAALGVSVDNLIGQLDSVSMALEFKEKYLISDKVMPMAAIQAQVAGLRDDLRAKFSNFGNVYNEYLLNASKISFNELRNLAITSDEINEIRLSNMNVKNNTRWISLSSLISCFEKNIDAKTPGCQGYQNDFYKKIQANVFGKYTFGYSRRESDNSVITPSANANFIYVAETNPNYEPGQLTMASSFNYSIPQPERNRFILSEAIHATIVPASYYEQFKKWAGKAGDVYATLASDVALIYKSDCENPELGKCLHPAYKFIVEEFADCSEVTTCNQDQLKRILAPMFTAADVNAQEKLRSELHGFVLELNLRVPKGYDMKAISHINIFNNLQMNFADKKTHLIKSTNTPYEILLARPEEVGSLVINKVTRFKDQDQLRVAMMGLIVAGASGNYDAPELEKGTPLQFTINLPGLKPRKVQAVVRPYHTTFADMIMAK